MKSFIVAAMLTLGLATGAVAQSVPKPTMAPPPPATSAVAPAPAPQQWSAKGTGPVDRVSQSRAPQFRASGNRRTARHARHHRRAVAWHARQHRKAAAWRRHHHRRA